MGARIPGTGVSAGIVQGPAHLLRPSDTETSSLGDPQKERQRFDRAVSQAADQLRRIAQSLQGEGRDSEAGIMEAQALMAQDPALLDAVRARIDAGEPSAAALQQEADRFRGMLEALGDEYMAARAADIQDVSSRIIRNMQTEHTDQAPVEPSILVARDLTPSETASLDRSLVLGFATDTGSPTSHTAILAQALGIPAVVALGDITSRVQRGDRLVLDGESGAVIIDPNPAEQEEYKQRSIAMRQRRERLRALRDLPAETRDGRRVVLAANIGSADDLPGAVEAGAEGVGLFRTEFLFAGRERMPSEDEQVDVYRAALQAMGDHTVVVRTLDVGGDKPLPYLPAPQEENPFLGERGIRYTFAHPEVLRGQLSALFRASPHGKLAIMFPMVGDVDEVRRVRAVANEVQQEVGGEAEIGIMVEVPAAALIARPLARHVSFFSVGTNDLVQYTLAVDRVNDRVAHLYQPLHPAVLRLLAMTVEGAHASGRWAGVCGQMAGDPGAIPLLLGLDFDELSMSPGRILEARERIRSLDYAACRAVAQRALACETAEQVAELVTASLSR